MAPLAASLDILQLQGDKHTSLGYILPTLTVLKKRLGALQLRYTEALRDKLLQLKHALAGTLKSRNLFWRQSAVRKASDDEN